MDIRLGRFLNKEQCQGCHKIFLSTINLLFALTVMKLHMKNVLQIFFDFDQVHEQWQCWKCKSNQPKRCNPFSNIFHDKHHPDDSEA